MTDIVEPRLVPEPSYAWVVTLANPQVFPPEDDRESYKPPVYGPAGITDAQQEFLDGGHGTRAFIMYDDDGIWYYRGRYAGPDGDEMFAPLEDFGTPNAGCTSIRYRDPATGKYKEL